MTIHLDWLKTGRAPRGTPRRLFAIGLIAGLALVQAGCQSGPLANCGGCNSCGFFRRATSRVLNRPSGCCGSSVVGSDTPMEYSAPSTVVGPGATTAPMYSPGMGSGTVPSNVPLPSDPNATHLEPAAPTAKPGPPLGTGPSSGSGAGRTSYTTRQSSTKTAVRLDSGLSPERASISRPADESSAGSDDNPLDHLPPLGLPGEVTQSATASPSARQPEGRSGASSSLDSAARSSGSAADDGIHLLPAETTAEAEAPAGAGNGMAAAPVDPKLAGGSVPSVAGLGWLAEKGYRTVLDLRTSGEVSPAFIAEAAARGLRYVALPVALDRLDADRLARFQFELAAPEARPLFFFDSDGSRAGALWYLRRVSVEKVDAQLARREAEEIGLKDPAAWQTTASYLDRLDASRAHPAPARTGAASPPTPPPAAAGSRSATGPSAEADGQTDTLTGGGPIVTAAAQAVAPGSIIPPMLGMPKAASAPPGDGPVPGSYPMQDVVSWKPFAAMLLTGLSLPLAYWTRTAIPDAIARARASLPAPAPRPRSLPHESGE